jgi:hypothetical protein
MKAANWGGLFLLVVLGLYLLLLLGDRLIPSRTYRLSRPDIGIGLVLLVC